MPNDGNPPAAEAPAITADQLQQAIFGMISELAPSTATPESIAEHMQFAYAMEGRADFMQAFDALFNPEKVKTKPLWGVRLHHRGLAEPHLIYGPKRVNGVETALPHLSSFALTYGLLTSPPLRAVLMTHGYRIEFVEIAPKSPILLA